MEGGREEGRDGAEGERKIERGEREKERVEEKAGCLHRCRLQLRPSVRPSGCMSVSYVGQPNACNETGTLLALNSTPPPPITPLSQAKNRLVGVARMSATTELDGCF